MAWYFIDDYGRYVKIVRKYKIAIQRNTRPRGDSSTYISFFPKNNSSSKCNANDMDNKP